MRIAGIVDAFGTGIGVAEGFVQAKQILNGENRPHAGRMQVLDDNLPNDFCGAEIGRAAGIAQNFVVEPLRTARILLPPAADGGGVVRGGGGHG